MENNNSIPYGTISWDNEDSFSQASQQRESQRTPLGRNPIATGNNYNGLRYSLRGPQFPPPQRRLEGVGLSRQMGLASSLQGQLQTPHSNFQLPSSSIPSSSSSNNVQYERFFSLRPVLNTPSTHVQMQTIQQPLASTNSTGENHSFSSPSSNSLPGLASLNDPSTGSRSQFASLSTHVSFDRSYNNNNNVELPVLQSASLCEGRTKRKSSFSDNEDGQNGPASKQFLSEERMAARMHNLRISSDHNYPINFMQSFLDQFVVREAAGSSESQFPDDGDESENNSESFIERQSNMSVFVIHPEVKDALKESQANSILPEAVYKQISNPCLSVVPWKSPDETFHFPTENRTVDQDKKESDLSGRSSSNSCISLIMESIPEAEEFQDKGVHHVEIVGECSTFSLEDDDMEQ